MTSAWDKGLGSNSVTPRGALGSCGIGAGGPQFLPPSRQLGNSTTPREGLPSCPVAQLPSWGSRCASRQAPVARRGVTGADSGKAGLGRTRQVSARQTDTPHLAVGACQDTSSGSTPAPRGVEGPIWPQLGNSSTPRGGVAELPSWVRWYKVAFAKTPSFPGRA